MKRSPAVRERIMARWRDEVPEIARALLAERDFIMAEAVRRELANGAGNMCVVVGAGHLPGFSRTSRPCGAGAVLRSEKTPMAGDTSGHFAVGRAYVPYFKPASVLPWVPPAPPPAASAD